MLTSVEVLTARGETLALPLQEISNGYVVKEISGLDPVNAEITTSNFSSIDGVQFQAARRGARNIVIKLGLEPDYVINGSVRGLRSALYGWLMPKSNVTLRFFYDGIHFADIQGKVESVEAAMFSQEPEVQISILCFFPDFYAPDWVTVPGVTVLGSTSTEQIISYSGTSETGFIFTLAASASAMTGFTIYNTRPDNVQETLAFTGTIAVTDKLEINSIQGQKAATKIHSNVRSSALYGVTAASTWVQLYPGENRLRVTAPVAGRAFTLTYQPKYGGL